MFFSCIYLIAINPIVWLALYHTSEDRDLEKGIYLCNVLHLLSWRSEIRKCISLTPTLSYLPLYYFPNHFILSTKLYIGPNCLV